MSYKFSPCYRCGGKVEEDYLCRIRCTKCGYDFETMSVDPDFEPQEDVCKYCTEYEDLPEHIVNGESIGKVFDTDIDEDENGWHICLPSGVDIGIRFYPYCGRKLTKEEDEI